MHSFATFCKVSCNILNLFFGRVILVLIVFNLIVSFCSRPHEEFSVTWTNENNFSYGVVRGLIFFSIFFAVDSFKPLCLQTDRLKYSLIMASQNLRQNLSRVIFFTVISFSTIWSYSASSFSTLNDNLFLSACSSRRTSSKCSAFRLDSSSLS